MYRCNDLLAQATIDDLNRRAETCARAHAAARVLRAAPAPPRRRLTAPARGLRALLPARFHADG